MRARPASGLAATLRDVLRLSWLDGEIRDRERTRLASVEATGGVVDSIPGVLGEAERQLVAGARAVSECGQVDSLRPDDDTRSLVDQRRVLVAQLPDDVAAMYDVLVRARRYPVVTTVANGYCSACHLRIPPQLANAVERAREIYRCPHCQRLLCGSLGADPPHA